MDESGACKFPPEHMETVAKNVRQLLSDEADKQALMRKAKSWFTGYNSNVKGHEEGTIRYLVYNGGMPKYRKALNDVADVGYKGIAFSKRHKPAANAPSEAIA